MFIIPAMTGITIPGCAFVHAVLMAVRASHIGVRPGQWKAREIVIKRRTLPARCIMAGGAIGPELSAMLIIRTMAGVTVFGRAFIYTILMAARTSRADMRAGQREARKVVIERRALPA